MANDLNLGDLKITLETFEDAPVKAVFDLPDGSTVARNFPQNGELIMRLGLGLGLNHRVLNAPPPAPAISGTPVLSATEDEAYAGFTVSATGGAEPYTYSLVGTWPAGILIDSGTGTVSGTPTESGSFAGLSVRVTDDSSATADLSAFTLEVEAAAVTDFVAATAEVTQVINTTGNISTTNAALGGRTPKGALFFNRRSAGANRSDSAAFNMAIGATDGTSQLACAAASTDNSTSSAGSFGRNGRTDKCMIQIVESGGGIVESAVFNAWLTDGVQINIDDPGPSAFKDEVLLFAGSDLTVKVGNFNPVTGAGTAVDCGFQPDAVILFGVNQFLNGTGTSAASSLCIGFAAWDEAGVISEAYASTAEGTTNGTVNYRSAVNTDACHAQIAGASDAIDYKVNLTRDASGFTAVASASAGTDTVGYIALKIENGHAKVGTWALPTSTGAASKTGIGFPPKCVLLAGTDRTAAGVASLGTLLAFAAMTQSGGASIAGSRVSNGLATGAGNPTDQRTVVDNSGVYGLLPAGGTDYDITVNSMDSDGWTVNVVDAPAAAYLWPYLAIG